MRLAVEQRLADGSYLSHIYPCERDWRHHTNGVVVRVIDYRLDGVADAEPDLSVGHHVARSRPRHPPLSWRHFIMNAGRSRRHLMS